MGYRTQFICVFPHQFNWYTQIICMFSYQFIWYEILRDDEGIVPYTIMEQAPKSFGV